MVAIHEETYWDEELCRYEKVPTFPYPTEIELLKIFPEAKEIIPQKIVDWTKVKGRLLAKKLIPAIKAIDYLVKDEKLNDFFKQVYYGVYLDDRFHESLMQLKRLKRYEFLLSEKPSGRINLEEKKQSAKAVSILSLYSFSKLRKEAGRHKALCPFHLEKSASFVIYSDNTFHCFGCGANGDSIDFVRKLKNYTFPEAVRELSGVANG